MSTLRRSSSERSQAQFFAGLERLAAEVLAFTDAMLNPGRIIAEVEQMRELQTQASRIDPERLHANLDPARPGSA